MREQTVSFGGEIVEASDCTHLVIDNVHVTADAVESPNENCFCVTGEVSNLFLQGTAIIR